MSGGVLGVLSFVLLLAGVVLAPAAAAVDDPTRPDARVTHGPSCRPGGLVVEVTGGTAPYSVRLATTRAPGGEDEATVAPGATVVLRTDDVDWGEMIDGRVEYAARDGSGVTFVDELDNYSFTRPTQADCAAVAGPTQVHPPPSALDGAGAAVVLGTSSGGDEADRISPGGSVLPLVLAAAALVGTAVGFVEVRSRRSTGPPGYSVSGGRQAR